MPLEADVNCLNCVTRLFTPFRMPEPILAEISNRVLAMPFRIDAVSFAVLPNIFMTVSPRLIAVFAPSVLVRISCIATLVLFPCLDISAKADAIVAVLSEIVTFDISSKNSLISIARVGNLFAASPILSDARANEETAFSNSVVLDDTSFN